MKRHVALVGFMACGKTTIGRQLARRLQYAFADTDDLVERVHGSIAVIFSREGEAPFRRYETEAIRSAVRETQPSVIALGGGALTTGVNRQVLGENAHLVFLRVSAERVLARLRRRKAHRPLLGDEPTLEAIRALYGSRMPQYESADFAVDADGLGRQHVVTEIVTWLQRQTSAR